MESSAFSITNSGHRATATGPQLLVHGGAWNIPDAARRAHRDGIRQAVERGRRLLTMGTRATAVAAAVVAVMERHGAFDAGTGAMLRRDGTAALDAGIMEGATLAYGAVIGVRRLAEPIRVAHRLLVRSDGQARILRREGAEPFAKAEGFTLVRNRELVAERERRRHEELLAAEDHHTSHAFLSRPCEPHDTVGCVVRDSQGRLAAATSTGGTPLAPVGRVGDAPLPGAGFYANETAAVSATGWGEAIAAIVLSGRTVDTIVAGQAPGEAVTMRLRQLHASITNQEGEGATGGLIALDASGRAGWAYTTPRMARGGWRAGEAPWVAV